MDLAVRYVVRKRKTNRLQNKSLFEPNKSFMVLNIDGSDASEFNASASDNYYFGN